MTRCLLCGRRTTRSHGTCPAPTPATVPKQDLPSGAYPGYAAQRVLGAGGFGTVVLATELASGRQVAIKSAKPDPLTERKLLDEFEAMKAIGPPAVPQMFELRRLSDGTTFFVSEYLDAPTLGSRLDVLEGPMPLAEFAKWADPILQAVSAVHQPGFCHLDLKPENIFIFDPPPAARLIDFGLALNISERRKGATVSYDIRGTPEYMSPEQCEGGRTPGTASDIYSLGIIFFEMLTGRIPFCGDPAQIKQGQISRRPSRLSDFAPISAELEQVVLQCLAKKPEERYADLSALRVALQRAIEAFEKGAPVAQAVTAKGAQTGTGVRKETVGLLWLEPKPGVSITSAMLEAFGAQLASLSASHCVAVFDRQVSENPARLALSAAEELLEKGICARALVDLAAVSVLPRADGTRRFISNLFSQADRFPQSPGASALFLTGSAAEMIRDVTTSPVPDRGGLVCVQKQIADAPAEPTLVQMVESRFLGRADEMSALMDSYRKTVDPHLPGLVTVLSPAGYGKSRLCIELVNRLRSDAKGAEILHLRAPEPLGGNADRFFRTLLAAVYGFDLSKQVDLPQARLNLVSALGAEAAEELWPAVGLAMGWLEADARELAIYRAAPGALRSSAIRAAGEGLRHRAMKCPTALLLDNAHFADAASLDALEYATLSEHRAPLWVCAFARTGFEATRVGWSERAGQRLAIQLQPLKAEHAIDLCRRLLHPVDYVPEAALKRLVGRAEAIPLLLDELVRGLKRDGIVRQNADTGAWFLATDELDRLPDLPLLEWLTERELSSLSPELVAHAKLVASLGAEFALPEIQGVLKALEESGAGAEFPLDAGFGTQQLLEKNLLVRHRQGQLGFRNSLTRDSLLRTIPESIRSRIHLAASRHYRSIPSPSEEQLSKLAYHCAKANLRDESRTLYLRLAERAQNRHAYLDAEIRCTQALEQTGDSEDAARLTALRVRGLMRYRIGRCGDAIDDLTQARNLAHRLEDAETEIHLLLDEATALDWMSEVTKSWERVQAAKQLAGEVRSKLIESRLLLGEGRSLWRFSKNSEACELIERAAALSQELGDEGYETRVISLLLLGYIRPFEGDVERAGQALQRVEVLCEERLDRLHLAIAYNNARSYHMARADLKGFVDKSLRNIQIGRELGQMFLEYLAHYNLGEMLYFSGDPRAPLPHLERAIQIEDLHPDVMGRPIGRLLLARCLTWEGRLDEAQAHVLQIEAKQAKEKAAGQTRAEFPPSDQVLFAAVKLAQQPFSADAWAETFAKSERFSVEQEPIEVAELGALSAARSGHPRVAEAFYQRALQLAATTPNIMGERLLKGMQALSALGLADSSPSTGELRPRQPNQGSPE